MDKLKWFSDTLTTERERRAPAFGAQRPILPDDGIECSGGEELGGRFHLLGGPDHDDAALGKEHVFGARRME